MGALSIDDLQRILDEATNAYEDAKAAFEEEFSTENMDELTAAAAKMTRAKAAYNEKLAEAQGGNTVLLKGSLGKDAVPVNFVPGTPIKDIVASAGWNTSTASYAYVRDSQLVPLSANDPVPAGNHTIMVQVNVNAG
jgi:hypothetical protein